MLGNLQLQKNLLKININHILVYFSKLTKEEDDVFENINDLDFFFLRLQTVKGRILRGENLLLFLMRYNLLLKLDEQLNI